MATPVVLESASIINDLSSHTTDSAPVVGIKENQIAPAPYSRILKGVQREISRHGRTMYYYRPNRRAERIRLPDNYGSPEFLEAYRRAFYGPALKTKKKKALPPSVRRVSTALKDALRGAKGRAREKGLVFDLDHDWLLEQARAQGLACALTGIQFFSGMERGHCRLDPTAPSIDRIRPIEGYVKTNCRVISVAMNMMLNDWGDEIFAEFAKAYLKKSGKL